jgi:CDP-diacylglycerol---serine O-phosphatidyltransferase
MTWRQIVPMMITLAALLTGFLSILRSATGEFLQAAQLIMLSMILDGLDGMSARWLKGTTDLGGEVDTFVDMISFGLAPAVLAYLAVLQDMGDWGLIIASAMVVSGVLRLSRFRIVDPFRGQKGYMGLPITTNGGWVTLFIFLGYSGLMDDSWFSLRSGPVAAFVWGASLLMCALQVSHVHYAKPTKDPAVMIASVALVTLLFFPVHVGVLSAAVILAYGFYFAFLSPVLRRRPSAVEEEAFEDEEEEEEPVSLRHP